jgi:ADP-ribosyl-[dinitrogen reductase] hydrolase
VSDNYEIATKDTWNNIPMDNPKHLEIYLEFTESQFNKMKNGLIPEEMEDKWFIYYEEGFLYFHRSWTGFGIYRTKITKEPTGYIIREFWVERNFEKYSNTDDEQDRTTLKLLISNCLLNEPLSSLKTESSMDSSDEILKNYVVYGNMILGNKED